MPAGLPGDLAGAVSLPMMHPIERLRFVARSSGAEQVPLVQEAAGALGYFRDDPHGLVTACRRVLARQPSSGPLWWLCSRVLCAADPMAEAWAVADDLDTDPTARELAHALPEGATVCVLGWPELVAEALVRRGDVSALVVDVLGEGTGLVRRLLAADGDACEVPVTGLGAAVGAADLVVLEASVVGPGAFLGVAGSLVAAAAARQVGAPVWLCAGLGRLVPSRVWDAIEPLTARGLDPWERDEEPVPLALVDRVAGPLGPEAVTVALGRTDCPVVPELLRSP